MLFSSARPDPNDGHLLIIVQAWYLTRLPFYIVAFHIKKNRHVYCYVASFPLGELAYDFM
jgi:hypothetical protein